MRDSEWDPTAFTDLLRRLQEPPAHLSPQDIRKLAGISKPQIYRWLQGENRPQHDALQRLGEALERDYPHAGITVTDLMSSAGYGPSVRIMDQYASTEPVTNAEHIDDELARWINDALRHGVEVMKWDLNSPVERELFMLDENQANWNVKIGMREVFRAYLAQFREQRRGENGTPAANGVANGPT